METKNKQKLQGILEAEINNSIGYISSETTQAREDALNAYLRQPYGNEVEGKSSIVTGEVAEAIDGALPTLVRIFSATDDVVVYEPVGPGDEAGAKQATLYANHVFHKENNGVIILHTWFKDALLQKHGVVKAYWDDKTDVTKERYRGLTDDELVMLLQDGSMEIVEQDTQAVTIQTPQGELSVQTHDVAVRKKVRKGGIKIENIPPEEFLISKRARDIASSPFCAHRRLITRSELIAMGFAADVVNSLATSSDLEFAAERTARYAQGEQPYESQSDDESMQEVEVFECYIRTDLDGDGIAELHQIFYAGNEILNADDEDTETDYIPFHGVCPIPIPHKVIGESLADRTMDIQLIKTTITRQMLDNLYLTNNARVVAVEGQVNLDDLLTSTAGGVIRAKSQGAVQQLVVQNMAGQAFPMLEYLDSVQGKRTGVTEASQGLDPSILQNVTAAAVAAMSASSAGKVEMIARIFAETGVKSLFKGILHLLCKYQDKPKIVRLTGKYEQIDPRMWSNQYDVSINVGLGAGNRQEQMAMLGMVLSKQEQFLGAYGPSNPLVSLGQYRATLGRMVEAAGFKDSSEFYKQITPEMDAQLSQPQPQMPQIDPATQAIMAKTQADIQAQQAKAQADIQLAREKAAAQLQLEREKAEAQMALKKMEFEAEAQMKAMKLGAGISSNVEIPG